MVRLLGGWGWECQVWGLDRFFTSSHCPQWTIKEVESHFLLSLIAPDYDISQWLDVKFKLDLDFPNVGGFRRRGGRREDHQVCPGFFPLWSRGI